MRRLPGAARTPGRGSPGGGALRWSEIHDYAALARAQLALAENLLPESIAILRALHRDAANAQRHYFALPLETLLSLALLRADETAEALSVFRGVLDIAAPAGIFQTILDQGSEIGTLLARLQDDGSRSGEIGEFQAYRDRLLASWRERYQIVPTPRPTGVLPGLLSPRERSTLELIGQGPSNKEIARVLGITPETVKSHVKHIFVKLGVERRTQVLSRAQSLGLITTHY
jgi:LuxR family maltose regulon positive regulatory protein